MESPLIPKAWQGRFPVEIAPEMWRLTTLSGVRQLSTALPSPILPRLNDSSGRLCRCLDYVDRPGQQFVKRRAHGLFRAGKGVLTST